MKYRVQFDTLQKDFENKEHAINYALSELIYYINKNLDWFNNKSYFTEKQNKIINNINEFMSYYNDNKLEEAILSIYKNKTFHMFAFKEMSDYEPIELPKIHTDYLNKINKIRTFQ